MSSVSASFLFALVCALFVVTASATASADRHVWQSHPHSQLSFDDFITTYNKSYSSPAEYTHRSHIYSANVAKIIRHNSLAEAGKSSYWMGVNAFADLTFEEYRIATGKPAPKEQMTAAAGATHKRPHHPRHASTATTAAPAPSIDWRTKNAVTAVQNQISCGCHYVSTMQ